MGSVYCSQVYLTLMAEQLSWFAFYYVGAPDECKHTVSKFLLQPPPTYEESIRQSVELPYNIFPSNLDSSPPPSVYNNTGPDSPRPVSSDTDSPVLPVWFRLSVQLPPRIGKTSYLGLYRWLDSPKESENQRLIMMGSFTQTDWVWRTDDNGAAKEEPHTF